MFRYFTGLFLIWAALSACPGLVRSEEAQPEFIHFYQYKPTYFLMGTPYTKIEFSFEAQVLRSVPLYFGYTQLMFWDLFVSSPYFYDINYNPEVFYRLKLPGFSQFPQLTDQWLDLGFYEHESNGQGGANERSWDRVSLRYHTVTAVGPRSHFYWDIKAWVPIHMHPNNPDLAEYRGLWELNLTLADFLGPFFERGDLTLRLYPGGQSNINPLHGGEELTFRAKGPLRFFLPLVVVQVFHGYGESLLDYQVSRWGIRAGIGF